MISQWFYLAVAVIVLFAGCARGPIAISGTVRLDGRDLGNANLGFIALEGTGGRNAIATTRADGSFAVTLLPGEYKVAVAAPAPPFDLLADPRQKPPPRDRTRFPVKYSNPETTPLRLTVPSQTTGLELISRP